MPNPEIPFLNVTKSPEKPDILRTPSFVLSAPITEEIADHMQEWLGYWGVESPNKELSIYIATIGGNLSDSLRIADSMLISPNPIRTIAAGECYSGGAIIVSAGDFGKRLAYPQSDFLIHGLQISGMEDASLTEQTQEIDHLQRLNEAVIKFLAKRTGQPIRRVRRDTKGDTYFNAKEAKAYGLIDNIISYTKPLESPIVRKPKK